ncbi:MAG: cellulose synthase regulator BcsB, partial [Pseudomonas caspiana]
MSRSFNLTLASLLLVAMTCAHAQTAVVAAPEVTVSGITPSWNVIRNFSQLGRPSDSLLLGTHNTDQFEFTMRRDRIASDA